jgi:hypothetical protein
MVGPGALTFDHAAVHEIDSSWEVFRLLEEAVTPVAMGRNLPLAGFAAVALFLRKVGMCGLCLAAALVSLIAAEVVR